MFHDEPWKVNPFVLGTKGQRSRPVTNTVPARVFALL